MQGTPDTDVQLVGLDHTEGVADHADRCRKMWMAAIYLYWLDCERAARGGRGVTHDEHRALRDLLGKRRTLKRLCDHTDVDPDRAAWAMIDYLTRPVEQFAPEVMRG